MKTRGTDVMFALAFTDDEGTFRQLVITGREEVLCSRRGPRDKEVRTEGLRRRRRAVHEFLADVDEVGLGEWQERYGEGDSSGPGGWVVVFELGGRVRKWQGKGEYPPGWERLLSLVEKFIGAEPG